MVDRQIKASKEWFEKNQNIKKVSFERKEFFSEAEKKLYDWIIEQRKKGLGITYTSTKVKMLKILKK